MGGADHHAAVKAVGTGHVGDRGSGGDMEQVDVSAGGGHTRADGVLQHIAGAAGILAHHDLSSVGAAEVPAQEAADLIGVVSSQALAGLTTEPVRAKILSHMYSHSLSILNVSNYTGEKTGWKDAVQVRGIIWSLSL